MTKNQLDSCNFLYFPFTFILCLGDLLILQNNPHFKTMAHWSVLLQESDTDRPCKPLQYFFLPYTLNQQRSLKMI